LIDSESNLKAALNRMEKHEVKPSKTTTEYVGMGKIDHINVKNRQITIHHQPIPELEMPFMKMSLHVDDKVSLENIKAGDDVHFVLINQKDNYLITKIHPTKTHEKRSH
jgi:Cu/Ag efflux protein CusF